MRRSITGLSAILSFLSRGHREVRREYQAYGTTIALTEADIAKLPEANRRRVLTFRRIAEIAERA